MLMSIREIICMAGALFLFGLALGIGWTLGAQLAHELLATLWAWRAR
jgi:hypothetical protein